jgi:hypothetical protein
VLRKKKQLEEVRKQKLVEGEAALKEKQLEARRVCDHPDDHVIFQTGQCKSETNGAYSYVDGVHCASWRTPEQQGREDDEGKGWRLAVDVKSDLH